MNGYLIGTYAEICDIVDRINSHFGLPDERGTMTYYDVSNVSEDVVLPINEMAWDCLTDAEKARVTAEYPEVEDV